MGEAHISVMSKLDSETSFWLKTDLPDTYLRLKSSASRHHKFRPQLIIYQAVTYCRIQPAEELVKGSEEYYCITPLRLLIFGC